MKQFQEGRQARGQRSDPRERDNRSGNTRFGQRDDTRSGESKRSTVGGQRATSGQRSFGKPAQLADGTRTGPRASSGKRGAALASTRYTAGTVRTEAGSPSRNRFTPGGKFQKDGLNSGRGKERDRNRERERDFNSNAPEEENTAPEYVAGRHPVIEALKVGRTINRILVAEGAEGGSLTELLGKARAAGIVVQRVPRPNLTKIAGPGHQGVVAYVAPHDYAEVSDIVARETGYAPLVLLLDGVEDPYNFGAILRSAEATGVQGVVIPKRRSVPLTGAVAKSAAGAVEYVPVARVTNLVQTIDDLKAAGYWVVGTEVEGATAFTEVDYTGKIAIVIGAEGKGLSRLVKEQCDYLVKMPMLGKLQSLNASVAAGVLLYEVVRQRS